MTRSEWESLSLEVSYRLYTSLESIANKQDDIIKTQNRLIALEEKKNKIITKGLNNLLDQFIKE